MKADSIEKKFPVFAIENDLIVSKKGDLSLVYELQLPQIYSLDSESLMKVNGIFNKFLLSLPEGTIVQKQDYFFVQNVENSIASPESILSRSDNHFFYQKPILTHRCLLIMTKVSANKVSLQSNPKIYEQYISNYLEFEKTVESAIGFIKSDELLDAIRLDDDAILELLGHYFSLSNRETNVLRDIYMDRKLQVGDKYSEIYAITSNLQLPITIKTSTKKSEFSTQKTNFQVPFIQPLTVGLDSNHIYNQVIFIEKHEKVNKTLKSNLNKFKSLSVVSNENKIAYEQIKDLVDEVIEKELKFVKQHFSVQIWSEDHRILQQNKNEMLNAFKNLGITPYQVKFLLQNVYLGNCPGATAFLAEEMKFIGISEQSPIFLNFESYYGSNRSGILLADRKNGAPIRLDLWDDPLNRGLIVNRNRLIFGPSGTGKSFLVNHMASQYYEQGHHIVMIDIGNSYKKLCDLFKGQYFTYDIEHPLEFNPFYSDSIEVSVDQKIFLLSILMFLWKGDRPFKREEKQVLAKYLDEFYENIADDEDTYPCMSSFFTYVLDSPPLVEREEKYFDKLSFKLALQDFHDGKYCEILNSKKPINLLHERFIVFEMDNIKDHPILFPLVTMLCIDVVLGKIRKIPSVKKSIFIDECWKPISSGEMAEFIKYLYKTVRKFNGEVAIATQDVEDILDTQAGPAMINNTDTMILLSHKKKMASKEKFAQHLSFTENDLQKLFSTDRREVFIKVGNTSNVYKVKVSPERYACYTSNADENKAIGRTFSRTKNMEVSISQFVEEKMEQ